METQKKERKVKCFICGSSSEKNVMDYIDSKKRWVHQTKCKKEYEWQLKMIELDKKEWDELYDHIKNLHDLIDLPKAAIVRLKLLRRGKDMVRGNEVTKWKNGASFGLMKEAYVIAEKDINYWIKNKFSDDPRSTNCINYCITIAIDKLNTAYTIRKNKEEQKNLMNRAQIQMDYKLNMESKDIVFQDKKDSFPKQKKKDERDISSFL